MSKVWKEADKNFVFFDQVPALDWDKTYQAYIPKVLETNSTYDYYKKLQEFCALLNDGHTKVVVPWQLREVKEIAPPIKTELIKNKVIITAILNDTIKNQGLKKGMDIIEINGINIHEYASSRVKPYVSYSTEQDMNVQVYDYHLLKGHIEEKVKLKTNTGKVYSISRKLTSTKSITSAYEFRKLNDETGYLKLNRFWGRNLDAKFDSIFQDIQSMPKLIIDVSENTGGNNGYANYVLSHFVDKPFETSRWKTLMYMPAWVSWGSSAQWQDNEGNIVEPKEESKRYTKPVVVLISEKTYSAGEDFVSAFLNTERGIVIGRTTAGSTGNPIGFSLPGEGGVQICSKRDYLANGKEFVGYGIAPQIEVKKVIDENHLINKGLEILKKEN
ncbi:S41 family peptidase [Winogradskyella sp. PE311]|uniref:S41 family peptidase n=1 Tax=Winogradskyella sp. PE311 TaxID=3366943 RepID=UPI00397FC921